MAQVPRIKLKSSPGKEPQVWGPLDKPVILQKEVLESDPETGLYFAWVHQMPPTRYFRVLRSYDCDEWVSRPFITVKSIQLFPEDMLSGRMGKREAISNQCFSKLKDKAAEDPTLRGERADGVVLDLHSFRVTKEGIFEGTAKAKYDGWAIQFVEPTLEEIRERLMPRNKPKGVFYDKLDSAIEEQQLRAAAYWVMDNKASQFAPALRALRWELFHSPEATQTALLSALATIEPDSADDEFWWKIIEVGGQINGTPYEIAANVLTCRNKPETVPRLEKVLKKGFPMESLSVAQALRTLNRSDLILKHAQSDSVRWIARTHYWDTSNQYECPYRGGRSAHWWQ